VTFSRGTFATAGRYEWIVRIDEVVHGSLPLEVLETSQLPGFAPGG
jgi:hypothetical protein